MAGMSSKENNIMGNESQPSEYEVDEVPMGIWDD